eukprot:3932632-Rhodomonas_salina.2
MIMIVRRAAGADSPADARLQLEPPGDRRDLKLQSSTRRRRRTRSLTVRLTPSRESACPAIELSLPVTRTA